VAKIKREKGIFMEQLYSPFSGMEVEAQENEKMEVGKQGKNPTYSCTQSVTHTYLRFNLAYSRKVPRKSS